MINIKDIQAGDYLRVNRDVCIKKGTIVEVRGIDADNRFENHTGCASCHPLDDNQFDGGIWCDYLDPIHLTDEILEKNFPEPTDGLTWFPEEGGFNCHTYVPKCEINAFGIFTYVHQLQNALRMCGIKKTIEL